MVASWADVSAIGLIDELSTNNYLVVETIDGRAFYVPLYRKPRGLAVGDSIVLMRASVSAGSETLPPTVGLSRRPRPP